MRRGENGLSEEDSLDSHQQFVAELRLVVLVRHIRLQLRGTSSGAGDLTASAERMPKIVEDMRINHCRGWVEKVEGEEEEEEEEGELS